MNSMAVLWNRIFNNAEEISYPEQLKATLVAIRPMVDIVLPGVEESSEESAAAAQHAFIGSQDDMGVFNISPIKSSRSDRLRIVSSGSVLTPSPMSSRLFPEMWQSKPTSDKKQTKLKLRHEDSQLEFALVERTSPDEDESQVLTERQVEVRERQRGQEVLYNMRSSSPARDQAPQDKDVPSSPQLPDPADVTPTKRTPAVQTNYDYVTSTPTPRRGQMLPLVHDVEMSDPPSSPPELSQVRRYPLVPEIQSRSADDDANWEYTSSPVSGSPLPSRVLPPRKHDGEKQLREGDTEPGTVEDDADDTDDVAVADSFAMEVVPSSALAENEPEEPTKHRDQNDAILTPTRRQTRQSTRALLQSAQSTPQKRTDSPRSENEEFVDAPTSPETGESRRAQESAPSSSLQSGDTSFALSEGAERSMIRLAEEMEASHEQTSKKLRSKNAGRKGKAAKASSLDCITVVASDEEGEQTPTRSGERVIPSTPHVEPSSQARTRKSTSGGRKRKRGSGSRQYETRLKRQRSETGADDGGSASNSPSIQRRKRMQSQEEEEVQSQVISEHMAASSQSRLSPELGDDGNFSTSSEVEVEDVTERSSETGSRRTSARRSSSRSEGSDSASRRKPAYKIERHFKKALERMRTATISREEMYRIEDMFVDFKRELYEAERRGRQE